jgi:hypothetical protein
MLGRSQGVPMPPFRCYGAKCLDHSVLFTVGTRIGGGLRLIKRAFRSVPLREILRGNYFIVDARAIIRTDPKIWLTSSEESTSLRDCEAYGCQATSFGLRKSVHALQCHLKVFQHIGPGSGMFALVERDFKTGMTLPAGHFRKLAERSGCPSAKK